MVSEIQPQNFLNFYARSLFPMSTKDLSYLLDGESSQGRGSEWAGGGSDPPNNYQQDLT